MAPRSGTEGSNVPLPSDTAQQDFRVSPMALGAEVGCAQLYCAVYQDILTPALTIANSVILYVQMSYQLTSAAPPLVRAVPASASIPTGRARLNPPRTEAPHTRA